MKRAGEPRSAGSEALLMTATAGMSTGAVTSAGMSTPAMAATGTAAAAVAPSPVTSGTASVGLVPADAVAARRRISGMARATG